MKTSEVFKKTFGSLSDTVRGVSFQYFLIFTNETVILLCLSKTNVHSHRNISVSVVRKWNCASVGVGLSQLYDQMFDGQNYMASNVKMKSVI